MPSRKLAVDRFGWLWCGELETTARFRRGVAMMLAVTMSRLKCYLFNKLKNVDYFWHSPNYNQFCVSPSIEK